MHKQNVCAYVSIVLERDALLRLGDRDTVQNSIVEVSDDGEVAVLHVLCQDVYTSSRQGQVTSIEREEVSSVGDDPRHAERWNNVAWSEGWPRHKTIIS